MTVYNDLRFLDAAIDSVLNQDLADVELIVVDDGTGLRDRFEAIAQRDQRIRVVINPTNIGTAAAANRGIEIARADIIARLDADDIAEPTHLSQLLKTLSEDSELGLVGSACTLVDETDRVLGMQPMPQTDLEIRWTMLFHNPFYHSTTAYRRSCFEAAGRYRPEELVSQDHYLWFDMLPFCRAHNLAEPLVRYRVNSQGLTVTNAVRARSRTHAIREDLWGRLGLSYDLYDDQLAGDITQFLRGNAVPPTRRAQAYRKLLTVLRAFSASARARGRLDDRYAAKKIKCAIVTRLLDEPPPDLRSKLEFAYSCCRIDIRTATTVAIARLWARTWKRT
jgi:glycosyltransferase involved in cell wall biosynthesis